MNRRSRYYKVDIFFMKLNHIFIKMTKKGFIECKWISASVLFCYLFVMISYCKIFSF